MNLKNKSVILTGFFLFLFVPFIAAGWSYPFKEISKTECKFQKREDHSSDCKRELPIIENSDYQKYKANTKYRLIYSVLWGTTYKNGWNIGNGSHLGVDIPTAKGTPVYSIGNGEVVFAGWKAGWGYTVVIKHKINGKYIYSNYAHLNSVNTRYGTQINEGEKIGTVGHSGNSWGNHLHFQIDTSSNVEHPFFFSCEKASNIARMVNDGACRDELTKYTTDPINFLETNGANIKLARNQEEIEEQAEKLKEEKRISPDEIVSREKLMLTELEMFMARYDISSKSKIMANTLDIGEKGKINLNIKDHLGRKFDGILPLPIQISFDQNLVEVSPTKVKYINNGTRSINIKGLKPGITRLTLKTESGKILDSYSIRVKDANTTVEVENAAVQTIGTPYVGEENRGIIVMKDRSYNNIIDIPYKGKFKLVSSENHKICPSGITSMNELNKLNSLHCNKGDLVNSINFSYSDTLKGLLLFKTVGEEKGTEEINVYKDNKKIGNSKRKSIFFPKDLDFQDSYYTYIKNSLKELITTTLDRKDGYFGPNSSLRETTALKWIKNAFHIKKELKGNRYNYITRLEFVKLICNTLGITVDSEKGYFLDISPENYKYVNLLGMNDIRLPGKYPRYFQPEKKIKRKEAAYILYKLYKKIK